MGEYFGMKKCSFIILAVLFFSLNAFAQQNIISSIIISKSKEDASKYELNIDSTKPVRYKMHNDEQGVWFELKDSVLAENAGTIYDDVIDIDSVSVKNAEKGRVNIYLQGKNVKNTELIFINSLFDTTKDTSKQISLANPIEDYQSTDYKDDLEDVGADWSDNSFSTSHLGLAALKNLKDSTTGAVLIFLSLFIIIAIIIKTLTQKLYQDNEPLIGLNNSYIKNSELIRDLNHTKALKDAQAELTKAHDNYKNYLKNKYQNNPKTSNGNIVQKSIALNSYKKSEENPYKNQDVIKINKSYTSQDNKISAIRKTKTNFTSPYIKRETNNIEQNNKKEENTTNMKFLESVTKIYEQSGRDDLARELRSSMLKIK